MDQLTRAQQSRRAIASFKTITDALILQGHYTPESIAGRKLAEALTLLRPEIYGSMSEPRIFELKGLEYVINRLPRGIEKCHSIMLTASDDFAGTSFEPRIPLKRRRLCYAISAEEFCFVITRGSSEVYDVMTHIVFLNIEAAKLHRRIQEDDEARHCWQQLESLVNSGETPKGAVLDRALWNLAKFLGRSYQETRESYLSLEASREQGANNSLFTIIYHIGKRCPAGCEESRGCFTLHCTPSMADLITNSRYASAWAVAVKEALVQYGLADRPIHVISANLHSFRNLLYAPGFVQQQGQELPENFVDMVALLRGNEEELELYAKEHGFYSLADDSGSNIGVQFIDISKIEHPDLPCKGSNAVLLILDYAFGTQAFSIMDELFRTQVRGAKPLTVASVSIMGKAGILAGKKGDIMLATAHVLEGTPDNYIVANDLKQEDFTTLAPECKVVRGSMLTVLGTSLQNSDILRRFLDSRWGVVGLEMEGAHYQRAISAATIRGRVDSNLPVRYAYYASDNPLISGQTLASGPMGERGIVPTYAITLAIMKKIVQVN